jgi:superfamily II DNA/RNA helicase
MLDMGFIPDIEEICSKLPKERQTLLFSATMPAPIKKLADKFLTNPKQIAVSRPAESNLLIEQRLVRVDARKKRDVLGDLLRREEVTTAIVFCNRKTTVRELATSLKRGGFKAGPIHGDMEQAERIRELDRFKAGEINILVASDVAARGLDIKGVSHVFNFDVPWQADDYVHRIGRTGRAGKTGTAYTLATKEDAEAVDKIEKLSGNKIKLEGDAAPADAAPEPAAEDAPAKKPRRGRGGRSERTDKKPAEPAPPENEREEAAPQPPAPEPRREPRPPRAEEPRRESRPPRREQRRDERREPEEADDGWNGPVPSFLGQGFGG